MKAAGIILILLIAIYATSTSIDVEVENIRLKMPRVIVGGRFMGPTILGFADLVADALWLIANEYFWNKEYLKLPPLFRTITWIDPHYILVYKIGAWHFAYNLVFVLECSEEKARGFVKSGIDFLKEGIANNPHKFDLYFELGWLYLSKVKNYELAQKYLSEACELEHADYVDHMLAHAYEKGGDIRSSLSKWESIVETNPHDMVAITQYKRVKELSTVEES